MRVRRQLRKHSASASPVPPSEAAAHRDLRVAEAPGRYTPDMSDLLMPPQTLASVEPAFTALPGIAADSAMGTGALNMGGHFDNYCNAFSGIAPSRGFIGYPQCSELAQYGLMRAGVETLADEMTRKFPEFGGEADAARSLNDEMARLNVRAHFRTMGEYCGYFGGGLLFMDFGTAEREGVAELAKPIDLSPRFIQPGSLRRLVPVEPISVAPMGYNSINPLRPDYFQPDAWFVAGVGPVHASRFLRFVKSEPPLLLRPAYNFFGIPDVQTALDYMLHFTETRESAARLLKKFSLTILKTDVDALLYGASDSQVRKRIRHLAAERDNDGVYAISMEDEDVVQLNTPLAGVTDIVRQALELLACVWRIPVVKFLGVSPSGMNSTGESDVRSFYDHVGSQQQKIFGHPFDRLTQAMQLSLFGEIRPGLVWAWPSLWEMTEREKAEVADIQARTDAVYLDRYVLAQEEVRTVLATDKDGRFGGIEADAVPAPPVDEGEDFPPVPETPESQGGSA